MWVQVIAENLSEEEIAGLKEMFKMMDTDNSGQINFEELKAGLERVGANMKESEIYQLMQAVSLFCCFLLSGMHVWETFNSCSNVFLAGILAG